MRKPRPEGKRGGWATLGRKRRGPSGKWQTRPGSRHRQDDFTEPFATTPDGGPPRTGRDPEGNPRFDPRATPRGISGSVGGYGEGAEGGIGVRVGDFRSDRSEPMLQLSDRQDRGPLGGSGHGERVACYIVCHGCSASRFGNCGLHWSGSLYTCRALACGPAFGRATMPLGQCRCVSLPSGPSANRSGSDVREPL